MDCLRVAKRLGAENVRCLYRRTQSECTARHEELEHAQEEGIDFRWLSAPIEVMADSDGHTKELRVLQMQLGDPDSSGRRKPVPIEGSEYALACDMLIIAIGQGPNPLLTRTTQGLVLNKWGNIVVNEDTMATSIPGVFAGGDIVTGAATVILAMGAGQKAASGIHQYLLQTVQQ